MRILLISATAVWVATAGAGSLAPAQEGPRVIHVTAERFSFTPSEIPVAVGEQIELRISSEDTSHGFRLVGTDINGVVPKRGEGELSVPFRGERPGRYTFECSRMCGAGHDFMRGVLVVADRAGGRRSAPR
jgi:cytochrome c oxidase subunit 2